MGWSKQRLINAAYGSFGLAGFAFSLTPEMKEAACGYLDSMMAQWATQFGVRIGYNSGGNNDTAPDLSEDSGIPDHACLAVYLGLAETLANTIGKTLPLPMNTQRANAFDALVSYCASRSIPDLQYRRNTPLGSGNKPYSTGMDQIFVQPPADRLQTGPDGFIDGNDGTPFYTGNGNEGDQQ